MRLAELRMKQILDERSMVEDAREEGKAEGKEEAAIGLLRLGISEEIIAQGSGPSIEKVREIKNRL